MRITDRAVEEIRPYEKNEDDIWAVYKHTFPNGKVYIGITSQSVERRWRPDGHGYSYQGLIYNAIKKYGWENVKHEVLEYVPTKENAEQLERYYIEQYKSNNRDHGYNIKDGGMCAKGHKLREETKKKMSESRKGENNWIYGKHLTDDVKRKLSEAHKGKTPDIEALRRGAAKRRGANAYNARKVDQVDKQGNVIARFESLADAARHVGIHIQDVYNCCVGRQKSSHGTRWKYAEKNDN